MKLSIDCTSAVAFDKSGSGKRQRWL